MPIHLLLLFFIEPPTTEIYTLSLHDALPIYLRRRPVATHVQRGGRRVRRRHHRLQPRRCRLYLLRAGPRDRKSTRLNSSHLGISYAVFCLKKKKKKQIKG